MKKKVHRVLLVDDDDDANFFQERLIRKNYFAESIDKASDGAEALEYLKKRIKENLTLPEIIFLDLNMPKMDGWKFMDEYNKFSEEIKSKITIIVLTSSINPDDAAKAEKTPQVKGYKNKFLTANHLEEVLRIMPGS